jgi:EAL domain-containing protein (putative c-di-GMP-specific phosphodiesterase class I)
MVPRFVDNILGMLKDSVAVTSRLFVEFTESKVDVDDHQLEDFADNLHKQDVSVLLDDVGKGRYDVHQMNRSLLFVCDGIKFPCGAVRNALHASHRDGHGRLMRDGMLALADRMTENGKTVTLEGIRALGTLREWQRRGMHVDYAQLSQDSPLRKSFDANSYPSPRFSALAH